VKTGVVVGERLVETGAVCGDRFVENVAVDVVTSGWWSQERLLETEAVVRDLSG
jgi:hypothetical protein